VSEAAGGQPDIIWLDSVGSTNAEAAKLLGEGRSQPVWVTAGEQTAGRGRQDRNWSSPPGNLYASLLLPLPGVALEQVSCLSLVGGLAVADSFVAAGISAPVSLKWPNDVLVDAHKAAGILIETTGHGDGLAAIIGCGVNLAHHPQDTRWPATHLGAHRRPVDPAHMLTLLAACMETRLEQWNCGAGQQAIMADWTQRAFGIGTRVRLHGGQEGVFCGLAASGALRVQLDDGDEVLHHAGDVEWSEALAGMA
jgi:BirA family biotin operon repressor/biotin-[acetyl-CoA-carboxylase] ligase